MKKRPNKRHLPHAASFKRMARELRTRVTAFKRAKIEISGNEALRQIAATLDGEATTIRSLR
jgi:hypothetical protein